MNHQILNNIYILDTLSKQLTQINVGGSHPSPRAGAIFEKVDNQMVLIGGVDEKEHKSDIFFLENISKIDSALESNIGKEFQSLFEKTIHSDIKFVVEGKEIDSHRIILSCRSQHFRDLFSKEHPNPIVISNFKYEHFLLFLKYLYSDSIVLNVSYVKHIIELARAYDIKQLELVCKSMFEEIIIPSTSFNNDFKWVKQNFRLI